MTAKTHQRWTDEDVHRLRLFADADVDIDTIAKALGRTRASVKNKAFWLNLSLARKTPPD
jgi:ParB-like chromosome segregation protein Spo0J